MISPCSCGAINLPGARFCGACGRALGPGAPPIGRGTPEAPFVGRARELAQLREALDAAFSGTGSLVTLVGEAGIGKTQIARSFAAMARARGADVLWGSCFEGDWSPPFGLWMEALGQVMSGIEAGRLDDLVGTDARYLNRLIPGLPLAPIDPQITVSLDPDEERFRLFDAVSQLLLALARKRTIVLVLDDLHWADSDSLRLLRYVVRLARDAGLLVVSTHREPGTDPTDRGHLADALAIIRRESDYQRIVVRGLPRPEVANYLAGLAGQELPQALLQAIYAASEGNPFYAREIFRHLVEEEKIQLRAGRWSTDISVGDWGIPEGVRQVVARRMSRLTGPTRRMLSVVAALSGGFEFRLLPPLLGLPEEVVLDSLDEALRAELIRADDGVFPRYDVSHAIVRQTLYGDMNPARRARLHREIATTLERVYAGRELAHAGELAYQYHASASVDGGANGVAYCLMAADDARAGYAFDRVVTYLRMARDLAVESSSSTGAAILQRLAIAEADALLLAESRRTIDDALAAMAEARVEPLARASFLAVAGRALKDGGASRALWQPLAERGLALLGPARDLTWARVTLLIDQFESEQLGEMTIDRWRGYDPDVVAILRTTGDEDDYARTLEPRLWHTRTETDDILNLSRGWTRPSAIMRALGVIANDLMTRHGAFREAAERLGELLATAERCGSIAGQAEALVQLVLIEVDLGAFALAREHATRARSLLLRLGTGHRLQTWIPWLSFGLAYYLEGEWESIASAVTGGVGDSDPRGTALSLLWHGLAALVYARAGKVSEANRLLVVLAGALDRAEPRTYGYGEALTLGAEAAWALDDSRHAPTLRRLALGAIAAGIGDPPLGAHALVVARMAALLGDQNVARDYFARARAGLAASGRRPLQAIVDYDEARVRLMADPIDRPGVGALLDAAVAEFARLGMNSWEQRARDLRERLPLSHPATTSHSPNPNSLTPRETEVLRLIAAGQSNREIAAVLVVSVATVERHISNVYGKIGARGRADATTYAWQHGLAPTR